MRPEMAENTGPPRCVSLAPKLGPDGLGRDGVGSRRSLIAGERTKPHILIPDGIGQDGGKRISRPPILDRVCTSEGHDIQLGGLCSAHLLSSAVRDHDFAEMATALKVAIGLLCRSETCSSGLRR